MNNITFLEWMLRTTKLRLEFGLMIKENVPEEVVVDQSGWNELAERFAHLRTNGNTVEACWADLAPSMGGWVDQPKAKPENVMVYLNGRENPSYRCECGGNVFTKAALDQFRCNSCDALYHGVKKVDQPQTVVEIPLWQRLGWPSDACPGCASASAELAELRDGRYLCDCSGTFEVGHV